MALSIAAVSPFASASEDNKNGVYGDIPDYGEQSYLSPDFILAENGILYFTCRTDNSVVGYSVKDCKKLYSSKTGAHPSGLVDSKDILYVSVANPDGRVLKISKVDGKILAEKTIGHMPRCTTLSSDDKYLYVANQFEGVVRSLDAKNLNLISQSRAVREPFSMVASADGKKLVVLNQLPEAKGGLTEENIASAVSIFKTNAGVLSERTDILLPVGSVNCKDIALSNDGKYAFCTHTIARFTYPTAQVERGWVSTNAVSIIDIQKEQLYATFLLDEPELGAANPYGVRVSSDGNFLAVAHAGTHEVSIINLPKLLEKIDTLYSDPKVIADKRGWVKRSVRDRIMNDMTFLDGIRQRVKLDGFSPRHLAFDGQTLYVTEYHSDGIAAIDMNNPNNPREIEIGGNHEMNLVRRGEMNFHDASMCLQQWLSCTTCHTEVRTDALNWDLLNDGIGNPKQSKSMLFSHYTPPCMITGVRKDAETAVRSGIKYIQFANRPESDALAIDAYLKSLRPVPSPKLVNGKLSELAEFGEAIFEDAGCAHCHKGEYYSDGLRHDVGTGINECEGLSFDTPTLREIWRTAPYLYDGRAKTIFEMLKDYNKGDRHGKTSDLTDEDLKALEEYVLSL